MARELVSIAIDTRMNGFVVTAWFGDDPAILDRVYVSRGGKLDRLGAHAGVLTFDVQSFTDAALAERHVRDLRNLHWGE